MTPQFKALQHINIFHAARIAFAITIVELCNGLTQKPCRFDTNIPIAVHHQLIKIGRRLPLLFIIGISSVAIEQPQINLQIALIVLTARLLQKIPELTPGAHAMHHGNVGFYTHVHQRLHRVIGILQRYRRHLPTLNRHTIQRLCIHTKRHHVVMKILESGIYELITAMFFRIHILQLIQDDLKRFFQRADACAVFTIYPLLLDTEIRIDQHQRFHTKTLRFQIPGGMVRSNMPDVRNLMTIEPAVRVVIVHVRHRFTWLAAKFSQVVTSSRAAHQRQVNRHANRIQRPCHKH